MVGSFTKQAEKNRFKSMMGNILNKTEQEITGSDRNQPVLRENAGYLL
jgi:hypothetical protein